MKLLIPIVLFALSISAVSANAARSYNSKKVFYSEIQPLFEIPTKRSKMKCTDCHSIRNPHSPLAKYENILKFIKIGSPYKSRLFKNASGSDPDHDHINWKDEAPKSLKALREWIYHSKFDRTLNRIF